MNTNQTIRVLIVDDDEDDYMLACDLLEDVSGIDYEPVWAPTFQQGLDVLGADHFDVCLVDYRLGAQSGLEFIEHVQNKKSSLPMILLTGMGAHEVDMAATEAGASDYMGKGEVTPALLEKSIRYAISHFKVSNALRCAKDELEERVKERTAELEQEIVVRKSAEETLRKLSLAVEQSPIMIFITDTEGNIEYVNKSFTEMTGYQPVEVIGQTPKIIKSGETPVEVYEELWTTITAGNEWQGELMDRHQNGGVFWAEASISPVRDSDGGITHFVAMHKNITDRKLAEQKMMTAKRQAEIANRTKSEILANMSHELRTPLNAILGFSGAIREEYFGPIGHEKYKEYIDDISSSGEHLLALINDILDVAVIEAGKLTLNEENLEIRSLVETAVRLINHRAEKGEVTLNTRIVNGLPMLYADERRIKQILLNLLSNAVKFTRPGGTVTLDVMLDDDGTHTFTVTDTGIGMTDDEIIKAMTQFGQVDRGVASEHEGAGLGLPLTKGLVESHGGTMIVTSEKNAGTSVTVRLPKDRVVKDP